MTLNIIDFRLWSRENIVRAFFYLGMTISFLGSITPWFFWPIEDKYVILSSICFLASMSIANVFQEGPDDQRPYYASFYERSGYLFPILLFVILSFYQLFIRGRNINAFIINLFYIVVFFSIFKVKLEELRRFCDLLAKCLGGFMVVSMSLFLLYIIGLPLPCRDANYIDMYSFINYYFFLIDDRSLFTIIPRFQSIFVEPGHLGTMTAMLLFTQIGKWKRWYNISLLTATFISFSLAAYGILVAVIFLGLWIRGKQIFKKAFYAVTILAAISIGSFLYNNGDNLLHDLIMIRLEIEDGEMAGDNRVTDSFKADYESLLQSSDVLTGRDRNLEEFGNSGYRVFIYDYGLIGVFLLFLFYAVAMYHPHRMKELMSVLIIAVLNFIIRGRIIEFYIFIPLYQVVKNSFDIISEDTACQLTDDHLKETSDS